MYTLREYQRQAVDAAVNYFTNGNRRNGLIVLPTGSGKSLVIANIINRLDTPVLVFQPSKEILIQNYEKLCSYGVVDCSVFSASCNSKQISRITFATIGSVNNCKDWFMRFRYVIIDECHQVNPEEGMYHDFIKASGCKVIGLTATPYRLYSSRFYGAMLRFITRTNPRIFNDLIYFVQIRTLADQGFLARLNYYQLNVVDPARLKVNSTGFDYTDASMRAYYREIKFNDTLDNIIRRLLVAGRDSILVFTKFVDEAENLVRTLGTEAAVVSSQMDMSERDRILRDFKAKRIKVVANVGVLTTGFDFPELATVVLARPTRSLALYYQMVGRAIRPHVSKQEGWIVDLCGNYRRFGRVDELEIRETKPGLYAVFNGSRQQQLTNVFFK